MPRSAAAASSCSLRRREFPTVSGPVDYALFVDKRFCGVVEAKPAGTTLSGFSEQAARYIADAPDFLGADPRQRRFEYVASDTETLFRDLADPEPRSRRLFTFHRPETLRRWISEPETLRARLRHMPPLVTEGLRQCQVEAIQGLERSLARDDPRALVQMTMGAGKTFTAGAASYRVLAHARLRRVLFLVDRRNLGNQTATEYAAYRPPGTGRLFTDFEPNRAERVTECTPSAPTSRDPATDRPSTRPTTTPSSVSVICVTDAPRWIAQDWLGGPPRRAPSEGRRDGTSNRGIRTAPRKSARDQTAARSRRCSTAAPLCPPAPRQPPGSHRLNRDRTIRGYRWG